MKKFVFIGLLLLIGCASTSRVEQIEQKLSVLEADQTCSMALATETKVYLQLITADPQNVEQIMQLQQFLSIAGQARLALCSKAAENHNIKLQPPQNPTSRMHREHGGASL